ncbi:uncharacterized protein LOC100844440 isoform X2 [Brachypodium distachyon]|uniref:Negatively light-regulated protein n=1 Tax=Brachypodium distachyon TaxID=15368 RepID=A0A0Q3J9H3_BRADI|nr:uncharacterized protein LOC100844440 isoform X2 [Brachypodium distachyon]KQK14531.1 hypothetical protein BRADI_1g17050v3 [Brachypodium distachyon]|eukprot:XP_010233639.1 uncharacterized protein LOC100844440 isoform X2 [Brachypodium distachyon]
MLFSIYIHMRIHTFSLHGFIHIYPSFIRLRLHAAASPAPRDLEMAGCNGDSSASLIEQQEMVIEKKFGGIAPKKLLISKDRKRAYFDSADWVLDKQASNNSAQAAAAVESLKPKLERTPRHQLPPRNPACASS